LAGSTDGIISAERLGAMPIEELDIFDIHDLRFGSPQYLYQALETAIGTGNKAMVGAIGIVALEAVKRQECDEFDRHGYRQISSSVFPNTQR